VYRSSKWVHGYTSTGVQELYRGTIGTGILQCYRRAGVVQGYRGTVVVQGTGDIQRYRRSGVVQGNKSSTGLIQGFTRQQLLDQILNRGTGVQV